MTISQHLWIQLSGHCFTPKIHHQTSDKCICNTQYTGNCVGKGILIAGCKHSANHSIKHMKWRNQPCIMVYNIHYENACIQSGPYICMCKVDILWIISTTLFLKKKSKKITKYPWNSEPSPINPVFHQIRG